MGWKRVAWAGCVAPLLGGCHIVRPASDDAASGVLVTHTQASIEHEIRKDAREAWREVRGQYPRRCFTAEFRDGFLDGYADYLDRGGDAQPPAVPPLRYTRHQKYYTPEGHALLKDYFLGFKYGVDVAVATGQRQYLTVPVLVPDGGPPVAVPVAAAPAPTPPATPAPLPTPRPLPAEKPPLPGATKPAAKPPAAASIPGASKFDFGPGLAVTSTAADTNLPAPNPPLPVVSETGVITLPAVPTPKLPEPPAEVPSLPSSVPTPPLLDDLPLIPPNHTLPPPLPANHPDAEPAK